HSRDVHNLVFLGRRARLEELFAAEPALANLAHFRSRMTPLYTLPDDPSAAIEMARFLLAHGADPDVRTAGVTPADAARKRGLHDAAALLDPGAAGVI